MDQKDECLVGLQARTLSFLQLIYQRTINGRFRIVVIIEITGAFCVLSKLTDLRNVREEIVRRREATLTRNGRTVVASHRGTRKDHRENQLWKGHVASVELHRSHDRPSILKSGKVVREPHLFEIMCLTSRSVC